MQRFSLVSNDSQCLMAKWNKFVLFCINRGFDSHYGFYNGHLSYYDHEADEAGESINH